MIILLCLHHRYGASKQRDNQRPTEQQQPEYLQAANGIRKVLFIAGVLCIVFYGLVK